MAASPRQRQKAAGGYATGRLAIIALMVVPLGIAWLMVSLRLPHGGATWKGLIPGALLVAVGFQVTHGVVVWLFGRDVGYGGLVGSR